MIKITGIEQASSVVAYGLVRHYCVEQSDGSRKIGGSMPTNQQKIAEWRIVVNTPGFLPATYAHYPGDQLDSTVHVTLEPNPPEMSHKGWLGAVPTRWAIFIEAIKNLFR